MFPILQHLWKYETVVTCDKTHRRHCLLYKLGNVSAEVKACRSIRQVYEQGAIDSIICRLRLWKFGEGDKSCQNQKRCLHPSRERGSWSNHKRKSSPNTIMVELAETFNVYRTKVERQLETLGFITKLVFWVPIHLQQIIGITNDEIWFLAVP